jgi:ParB-like chromosome segregation protein Spo0J
MTLPTKEYEPHPVSEIFSRFRMEGEELDALGTDIKTNGLKEAIWLFEDKILDGNNRYRAGLKASYRFKDTDYRVFDPKVQGDPLKFVVSANLHRRHLTTSQRSTIAAALSTTELGYNQYNRPGVTTKQAAEMLGVSEATVKMAKDVAAKAAPQIKEMVQKGELRLAAAKGLISNKRNQQQQLAELARIKKEREDEKAAAAKARAAKASGNTGTKVPKANQEMTDLDDFKKKWRGFNEMQRRGFVETFEDELAKIIELARQQRALIGVHEEQPVAAVAAE